MPPAFRGTALALVLASCSSSPASECMLEPLVLADVAGRDVVDCGAGVTPGDGGIATGAWAAAQKCVLDALCASGAAGCTRRAFTLIYEVVPDPAQPPQHLRAGLSGVPAQDGSRTVVKLYAYSGDPHGSGDASPSVSATGCQGNPPLAATPGCTPASGRPCLDCVQASVGTLLCGSQP